MPQMMPLNWVMLMIFSLMMFYLFSNWNYFIQNYMPNKMLFFKKKIIFNWKW